MSGNNQLVTLTTLLEKTEHYDKDERYMATSDLCNILQKHANSSINNNNNSNVSNNTSSSTSPYGIPSTGRATAWMDSNKERRICTRILSLLDDSSNDVQAIAVKTLGVLLTVVQEEQVIVICDRLCTLLLKDGKNELRDVYSIGLRTLIKTIPKKMGGSIAPRLTGRLLTEGLQPAVKNSSIIESKEEIILSCLEVLQDVVSTFGNILQQREHDRILSTCFELIPLSSHKSVSQKRACTVIGTLSTYLNDVLLSRCVESLLSKIQIESTSESSSDAVAQHRRAFIRTMCLVSHTVGHRLGKDIDRIVPIFLLFCGKDSNNTIGNDKNNSDDDDDVPMEDDDFEEDDDEHARNLQNELREACFAGFESFVLYNFTEVQPFMNDIMEITLRLMTYDPNYSYDDDDDDDDDDDMETNDDDDDNDGDEEYEDDEDSFEEEDDYFSEDDDDESWKVRRSAVRCLSAVITAMKAEPSALWTRLYPYPPNKQKVVADALLDRFKEREDNCRKDIIDCFTKLLSVTIDASLVGTISLKKEKDDDTEKDIVWIDLHSNIIPVIINSCRELLKSKKNRSSSSKFTTNERTKSSALALLSTLCQVPDGIASSTSQITLIFSLVESIICDSTNKTLKLDALTFMKTLLSSSSKNHLLIIGTALVSNSILKPLCDTVQNDWYKVIAESLRVLAEVPKYLATITSTDDSNKLQDNVSMIFTAIKPRLSAYDLDQEIKECALIASSSLLSHLSQYLTVDQRNTLLYLILDRLKNETTRLSSLKTLSTIASSQKVDLSIILSSTVYELSLLLRQQNRALKQSVLETLNIFIVYHFSTNIELTNVNDSSSLYDTLLKEVASTTIIDSDLHIANLGLIVCISILDLLLQQGDNNINAQSKQTIRHFIKEYVLPPTLILSTSNALQDMTTTNTLSSSLLSFFEKLIVTNTIDFSDLYNALYQRCDTITSSSSSTTTTSSTSSSASSHKHAFMNLSKCLAVITAATSDMYRDNVIQNLLAILEAATTAADGSTPTTSQSQVYLLLLVSGEIGLRKAYPPQTSTRILNIYLSYLLDSSNSSTSKTTAVSHYSEEMKYAAAYAFGRAAVSDPDVFLTKLLSALDQFQQHQIQQQLTASKHDTTIQKVQYLLLSALKEFITCHSSSSSMEQTNDWVKQIMPHLITHSCDKEESVRMMVAECLGCLTSFSPATILPQLRSLVQTQPASACTCVNAIKFAIASSTSSSSNKDYLKEYMPSFLILLQKEDSDLSVKNATLLMVYSSVHHYPALVVDHMEELILPSLYKLAKLNLKRVVDLGPFKHTVDDALPLRKTSLSIFSTSLGKSEISKRLDINAFLPILANALSDNVDDIQLQAHQILITMCDDNLYTMSILSHVDTFIDPLEKCIWKKIGSNKTATELERSQEWVKSGLRALLALSQVEGAMNSRRLTDLVQRTKNNAKFHAMLEALVSDEAQKR